MWEKQTDTRSLVPLRTRQDEAGRDRQKPDGNSHDMLAVDGPYSALLKVAIDGSLKGW